MMLARGGSRRSEGRRGATVGEQCYFTMERMDEVKRHLVEHGYAVVDGVIAADVCDGLVDGFKDWWRQFGDGHPQNMSSIIHQYKVGHIAPTWKTRLLVKDVFAKLWGTDKLLTSFDGVAIAEPPELGRYAFAGRRHELHLDQGPPRRGLHAYQGAVYLEQQTVADWCFQILADSHHHYDGFYEMYKPCEYSEYRELSDAEVDWYVERKGCSHLQIPVQKGSVMLWDAQLVHAGAAPEFGRANNDRWRFVTFVSMTPAAWVLDGDTVRKQNHYHRMLTTRHWSSGGVEAFDVPATEYDLRELPDVAKTTEARRLAGVDAYDLDDGGSNGPDWLPEWV